MEGRELAKERAWDRPDPAAAGAGHRRLGALVWICAAQFFLLQGIVQLGWTTPFSLRQNFISDLGNTACAPYPLGSGPYVCSPWHAAMNVSFFVQGCIILLGGLLLFRACPASRLRAAGFALLLASAPGLWLVALYPENENLPPHKLGAGLQFVLGNLGVALLGVALARARRPFLGTVAVALGAVGLVATWLLVTDRFLGFGIGGMERLAAYPLPLWLMLMGVASLRAGRLRP